MRSVYPDGPSLRHVQEWLAARILGPASGELTDPGTALDAWLSVPSPAGVAERVRVHADGYPARVHESLADTFPAVVRLVGPEGFAALAHRYAAAVPLTSYNLNDAGAALPDFLRANESLVERPFLADLAELEWRVAMAFHADHAPPLDPGALGWSVDDWAGATLRFQPSVAVLSSVWPLLELWSSADPPVDPEPSDRPDDIVVRRVAFVVRCESVPEAESRGLRLLLAGCTLAETSARLEEDGHDPALVFAAFNRWVRDEMIVGAANAIDPVSPQRPQGPSSPQP